MKTKIIFFFSVLLISQFMCAQNTEIIATDSINVQDDEPFTFMIVEEKPLFEGGDSALMQFIANNVVYPEEAVKNGIQGRVYVKFVINKKGEVTKAKIARSVHSLLDEEALRVVNLIPDWTPGKQKKRPVDVAFIVPLNFDLQDE